MDNDYEDLFKLATARPEAKSAESELTATDLVDLQAIHDSVAELLKHFWMCFPPTNPDMDEKVACFAEFFLVRFIFHSQKLSLYKCLCFS